MLVGLLTLISYLGRSVRTVGAVIGGLGFGFFIDELGKFITSDNDYFFQPAAALIYIIFIVLYLATRATQRRRGFSRREYLVNAVEALVEAARHDLDEGERRRAIELISKADPADPLTDPVRRLLAEIHALPSPEPGRAKRLALAVRARYFELIEDPRFARRVGIVFGVWAFLTLIGLSSIALSFNLVLGRGGSPLDLIYQSGNGISFVNVATLVSSVVSFVLVGVGLAMMRRGSRLDAYRWFERALLVAIFIGQSFAFIESQFGAVFGLGVDLLLLVTLRYMIRRERQLERESIELQPA
jgi:hypothetical protein